MKKITKTITGYLLLAVIGLLIVPTIALAAWWNPFSWNIWNSFKKPQTVITNQIPQKDLQVEAKKKINSTDNKDLPTNNITQDATTKNNATADNKPSATVSSTKLTNAQIIKKVKPATVYIETEDGSGSGMILTPDGYVLTNAHVVGGFSSVKIFIGDKSYSGRIIGRDSKIDLAIIKIDSNVIFPVVELGILIKLSKVMRFLPLGSHLGLREM